MKLHIIDEAERCLKCKKPLCQQGCPIHTPIPQITQLLLENRLMKAGEILFAAPSLREGQSARSLSAAESVSGWGWLWIETSMIPCEAGMS